MTEPRRRLVTSCQSRSVAASLKTAAQGVQLDSARTLQFMVRRYCHAPWGVHG
jgi:hypothetical protein